MGGRLFAAAHVWNLPGKNYPASPLFDGGYGGMVAWTIARPFGYNIAMTRKGMKQPAPACNLSIGEVRYRFVVRKDDVHLQALIFVAQRYTWRHFRCDGILIKLNGTVGGETVRDAFSSFIFDQVVAGKVGFESASIAADAIETASLALTDEPPAAGTTRLYRSVFWSRYERRWRSSDCQEGCLDRTGNHPMQGANTIM